jgi:hypothetical protein
MREEVGVTLLYKTSRIGVNFRGMEAAVTFL